MTKLADKIEAAEGPSRELDREIWYNLFDKGQQPTSDPVHAPAYTASLDAAMTLADGLSEQHVWIIWNEALTNCSKADADLRKDLARFWTAAALRAGDTDAG